MDKDKIDKEFWKAYHALEQTIKALNEAVRACHQEKSMLKVEAGGRGRPGRALL